ncbi:hypothetical protein [Novosphingobium sp. JCM 18896]|uniref:hypothetical protein n=1 Tax=Novosphingobium sp. JCM 18896 TaxID=2989731 RepID=UPI002222818D|nr:hypothetical protein [Novosphingobium sp. JCM 18896]MCW1430047.1 hypothetical protein [Novosphingobium sp. JCM 18896]
MPADAVPVPIEAPAPVITGRFNVLGPPVKPRCPPSPSGEIVVCAQDNEQFRLRPLPDRYEQKDDPLELKLSENASAKAEVERAGVGGFVSNRIMMKMKLKF